MQITITAYLAGDTLTLEEAAQKFKDVNKSLQYFNGCIAGVSPEESANMLASDISSQALPNIATASANGKPTTLV